MNAALLNKGVFSSELHNVNVLDISAMSHHVFDPVKLVQIEGCNHAFRARFFVNADAAAPSRSILLAGRLFDCRND